ncbi:MAG: apolipoprotein N-acyltransferase [Deinococcales bacterium]
MFWLHVIILVICGGVFSFALPSVNAWWCALALVPLFVLVARAERSKDAFGYGFFFALSFFSLHLIWLPTSFAELFGQAFWFTYPPMLIVLGCFWGLLCWFARFLGGRGKVTLWLLPALWVLVEWLRSQGVFAFPWGTLGYIWLKTPLAQLADIAGVYGLSLLTAVFTSLVAAPFVIDEGRPSLRQTSSRSRRQPWRPLLVFVVLLGLSFAYSLFRGQGIRAVIEQPPQPETALLIQEGPTDLLGRTQGLEQGLDLYNRLSAEALSQFPEDSVDIVIWPEGAILGQDLSAPESGAALRQSIQDSLGNTAAIVGGSRYDFEGGYNSAFSIARGTLIDEYDKVFLVPFGEYFPFIRQLSGLYRPIFRAFGLNMLDSRLPGSSLKSLESPVGKVATYICYESIFPQVARTMVSDGASLLVNISNDAWFGKGQGSEQHFLMGSMRAIETRRFLLRAGVDGITAVVNPLGEVVKTLPRGTRGNLMANYQSLNIPSFYVRYGDGLMIILLIYMAIMSAMGLFNRR